MLGSSCRPCDCSGNSDPNLLFSDCDPLTGACRGCQHHTTGPRCQTCAPGFYGNALLPGNCTRRQGVLERVGSGSLQGLGNLQQDDLMSPGFREGLVVGSPWERGRHSGEQGGHPPFRRL